MSILPCRPLLMLGSLALAGVAYAVPTTQPVAYDPDAVQIVRVTPPQMPHATTRPTAANPIRVAIYNDKSGSGGGPNNIARCLNVSDQFYYQFVTAEEIRNGILTDGHFNVIVQPGGSGGGQATNLKPEGREKIRQFVGGGGGYLGICAGSYLASSNYDWSLHIINTRVVDREHWARGNGDVTLHLNEPAGGIIGRSGEDIEVVYNQGPLMAPATQPGLPAYTPVALFSSEIAKKGAPHGVMIGTTAIAAAPYENGRVICISPHPEATPGFDDVIRNAMTWLGKKDRVETAGQ